MSHITTDAGENAKNLRSAERFFLYTSRSAFLFAVADNDVVREDCSAILRFSLLGKGKTLHIHDWERDGEGFYPVEQLRRLLQNYPDTDGLILCGLDAALYHNPHFLEQLNFGREALSSFGIPMLFWLSSDAMRKLNWEALDLFSQRSGGTLYFTDGNENGAYAAGDISCKVYETDFDKPLLRALEARLQLLQHQLEEAEQQQAEPAIRANDVAIELLRLYLRMPGKRDAVQALLERYSHDFDLEKPAISADVANAYARTGESEKARLLLEKALLCYRKLALTNSEAYRSSVAKTLKSLAQVHSTIRDFHAAEGEYGEALALFRQLAAANPDLAKAGTDLNYSIIKAPFDGTIGISQVKLGANVTKGVTVFNTLSTDGPVMVDFAINEKQIPRFAELQHAKPADSIFHLLLPDNTPYKYTGEIAVIDRAINPQTGTLIIRLKFPNPDGALRAGMSCNVNVRSADTSAQLVAPMKAVVEQMGEYFVYTALDTLIPNLPTQKDAPPAVKGLHAMQKKVVLGQTIGDKVIVKSGLQPGEEIIVEGVQKLHDGSLITTKAPGAADKK